MHRIGVRKTHHEKDDLLELAADLRQGMAEVHLRLPGTVHQRHKHLPPGLLDLPDRLLYLGVAPAVTFFTNPLKDPLGAVALHLARLPVVHGFLEECLLT